MQKTSRNSLKGYTFQTYVLTLFLSKMDIDRDIIKIETECEDTLHFDDLHIKFSNGVSYKIQVKNYPKASIDDISVTDKAVIICGNSNDYNDSENNILIVNTDKIKTDTEFFGYPATIKNNIVILPLTPSIISDYLDEMFSTEYRELQIIHKSIEYISLAKFSIEQKDLPELIKLSTKLGEKTIMLRNTPSAIECGVLHIVGKPGVGKSHYVNELTNAFPDSIVYRFWVNSQDSYLQKRLNYDSFINELGLLVFKTPRKFSDKELIIELKNKDIFLIIDGLDHVENYNSLEFNRFVDFINLLEKNKIRTIVLSRPLQHTTVWNQEKLKNWTFNETRLYLDIVYDISDYTLQKSIYSKSFGYPIITHFISEHYKKYNSINDVINDIKDINDYYESLLNSVNTKSLLCVFATSNSFFTQKELELFSSSPELYDVLNEFIAAHPYLFSIQRNRIALIHDSFNAFLRGILPSYLEKEQHVLGVVKQSLLSGEIEYMARLSSFNFDDDFLSELLIKYSDFNEFVKIISSCVDFESIVSLYSQLRNILELKPNLFDVYKYYNFVLLYELTHRNDLTGNEGLIFQMLNYLERNGKISENIYSSNIIWNVYLSCFDIHEKTLNYSKDINYSVCQDDCFFEQIIEEVEYFNKFEKEIDYEKYEKILEDDYIPPYKKQSMLQEYLIVIYIFKKRSSKYYDALCDYIEDHNKNFICSEMKSIGLDDFLCTYTLSNVHGILEGLGFFEDNNIYRNKSLKDIIDEYSPEGSFSVMPAVKSYIRLANYEKRSIDILSINYAWIMYGERKDYSVFTIDDALIIFEQKGVIDEFKTPIFLDSLMNQSEKGISHLLNSYLNKKSDDYISLLVQNHFFDNDYRFDVFSLCSKKIDLLTENIIISRLVELFENHIYTKIIEYRDLKNVLKSKYCDFVLEFIKKYGFRISSYVGDSYLKQKLNDFGIEYTIGETNSSPYSPLKHGYIHEDDFEYILENNIDPCDVAKFVGCYYECLPYPQIFEKYNKDLLSCKLLEIIHNAIFARVIDNAYIGEWFLLIGNILKLIEYSNIDVDWKKLYSSFKNFLILSHIDVSNLN